MTDADVDGAHIRTLILTFLFRHMRPMIEAGYVYIAQPPLYRLKFGRREALYLQNDTELERILLRERLGDIEVADRYGESPRFTEVRYQRFLSALREYEGWAARLRARVRRARRSTTSRITRLIEEPADDARRRSRATSAPASRTTSPTRSRSSRATTTPTTRRCCSR